MAANHSIFHVPKVTSNTLDGPVRISAFYRDRSAVTAFFVYDSASKKSLKKPFCERQSAISPAEIGSDRGKQLDRALAQGTGRIAHQFV